MTRQHLTRWLPVALTLLVTVGYVEWRTRRVTEVSPTQSALRTRQDARPVDANVATHALALAAAANARAERAELATAELEERQARRAASDVGEGSAAPSPTSTLDEQQRAQEEEFFGELDERLATEPLDTAWRAEKETAFATAAATLTGFDVSLAEATCASSLCKIRLAHPAHGRLSRTAMMQFLTAAHDTALKQLSFNFKYEEGSTTVYATLPAPR